MGLTYLLHPSNVGQTCLSDPRRLDLAPAKSKVRELGGQPSLKYRESSMFSRPKIFRLGDQPDPKCMDLAGSQVHITWVWHVHQTQNAWIWQTIKSIVCELGWYAKSTITWVRHVCHIQVTWVLYVCQTQVMRVWYVCQTQDVNQVQSTWT